MTSILLLLLSIGPTRGSAPTISLEPTRGSAPTISLEPTRGSAPTICLEPTRGPAPTVCIAPAQPPSRPIVVVETPKGTIEFELYPEEAPKSVAHVIALVKQGFYDGQRVHRALPDFLVQWGDPLSRDLSKRDLWGRHAGAGSGKPIGVGEVSKKRRHLRGTVGLAHTGDPRGADSQIYITLTPQPRLDKEHTIIGQVVAGDDVLSALVEGDEIRKVSLKEASSPF